jgi:WD40 repeat protein
LLRSHFDVVRSAYITQDEQTLATVSEDCMIKLWHLPEFEQKNSETRGNIEPFMTLRGHTGPLFAASGRGDILFTGGLEGVVKVWQIPQVNQVN